MAEPQQPKPCKTPGCGVPITFQMVGGKPKPFNVDGTPHVHMKTPAGAIIGQIERYEGNNIHIKGRQKPLFITSDHLSAAMTNFPSGTVITLQPKEKEIGTVEWIRLPTKDELTKYQNAAADEKGQSGFVKNPAPIQTSSVTGQNEALHEGSQPDQMIIPSPEDRIRTAMKMIVPSERVGYRISLAGCVNSVIEMRKMTGAELPLSEYITYPMFKESIKKEAIELFLWMDGLTTQNIKEMNGD
jgi:hypothetical protein